MVFLDICRFSAWVTKCGNSTLVLPQNICLIGQVQGNMRRKQLLSRRGTSVSKKEEGTMGLGESESRQGNCPESPFAWALGTWRSRYPTLELFIHHAERSRNFVHLDHENG